MLPDRKNSAKDMAFCPTESSHTAAQGREHAALLALLKLQEDQPLERKLPEPYKWGRSTVAVVPAACVVYCFVLQKLHALYMLRSFF